MSDLLSRFKSAHATPVAPPLTSTPDKTTPTASRVRMMSVWQRGRRVQFESALTDEQALKTCETSDSPFARELVRKFDKFGNLSDAQIAWVHKIATERLAGPKPTSVAAVLDFTRIGQLFDRAFAAKLKHPAIVLDVDGVGGVRLSVAGDKSRHPGSINVTSDDAYESRTFYGRIDRDGSLVARNEMTQAIRDLLARFAADPASVASEYGKRTGNCCFCRQRLSDPRSASVGYGATCAKRWSLPWGATAPIA